MAHVRSQRVFVRKSGTRPFATSVYLGIVIVRQVIHRSGCKASGQYSFALYSGQASVVVLIRSNSQ